MVQDFSVLTQTKVKENQIESRGSGCKGKSTRYLWVSLGEA
jgi:hypothetical protein